jgi:Sec-independent protein translocase protein TatA
VIMGPSQLPKMAQMLGKSAKALKDGIEGKLDEEGESGNVTTAEREKREE